MLKHQISFVTLSDIRAVFPLRCPFQSGAGDAEIAAEGVREGDDFLRWTRFGEPGGGGGQEEDSDTAHDLPRRDSSVNQAVDVKLGN